jgi:N-glycosylase/DNA lyase
MHDDIRKLKKAYEIKKNFIKSRLKDFSSLPKEKYFSEMLFCLLTPQSQAKKCWEAVEQLLILNELEHKKVNEILSTRTRFHHTKTKRILAAEKTFQKIIPLLSNENKFELRNKVCELVNGYGLKEASHFLRNIGHSNNQIAILDRHILRNLEKFKVIPQQKIKSRKDYLDMEQKFLSFAEKIDIPADELDLLWWSQENGEIFK